MPLSNLIPADDFNIVETKLDATIDKVNEIDANLPGGTTGQILKKSSNTDYDYEWGPGPDSRDAGYTSFTGSQAMTNSYVTIGSLIHTTPNDGVTRWYQIIADSYSMIDLGGVSPQYAYRIYNSTTTTALTARSFDLGMPSSGFEGHQQNTVMYSGLIGPNETIVFQVKYNVVGSGDMNVLTGSMVITEIFKF